MNYLNYTDHPSLPEDLFPEIYKSLGNKDRFPIENEQYKAFEATQSLKNFTNSIFNFEHNTAVQVLYKDVDIHVDLFRTIAYNYIIDTGGEDVSTCFYDEFHNVTKSYKITNGIH